jgi:hypothetical protein
MESSAQHLRKESEEEPTRDATDASAEEYDTTADLYAQNELEQRHERMERVIAKAKSFT